jgi:hypothetical protein
MTIEEKEKCIHIKRCYGLENLHFYRYNSSAGKGLLHCSFISDPYNFVSEDELDLQFILNALIRQQGIVFFDDIGDYCLGMDKLKEKYLVLKLSGIS